MSNSNTSRRKFLGSAALGTAGIIGAAQLLQSCSSEGTVKFTAPTFQDKAPEGQPLRAGLVGCGGRGTGAAINFLNSGPGLSVVALADVFQDRVDNCRSKLKKEKDVDIPDANCFTGFDAYKQLLEVDLDYVILATPPFFRPEHFQACVEARKHVFMEKPVAVDPVGARAIMAASRQAEAAGLSVVTGTQRRHEWSYKNFEARVKAGMIGETVGANVYWNQNQLWYRKKQEGWTEMEFMLRDWVNWTWLSGDHITEQHIHNIDVGNWFMGGFPVSAEGVGSRQRRPTGDCYDNFSIDFVFEGQKHMHSMCRQINGTSGFVGEIIRGTKGHMYTQSWGDQKLVDLEGNVLYQWEDSKDAEGNSTVTSPYDQEHIDLITAIRTGNQIVEAEETAKTNLAAIMGREAAYTGRKVTWEEMMSSDQVLGPQGELSLEKVDLEKVIPVPGTE